MYVAKLWIKNFRSLQNTKIQFRPGLNVIVGKNNSGKSNVIEALHLILGEKNPTYNDLGERDFFRHTEYGIPQIAESITIIARLSGNDVNRASLADKTSKTKVLKYGSEQPDWSNLPDIIQALEQEKADWPTGNQLCYELERATFIYLFFHYPRDFERRERIFCIVYRYQNQWKVIRYVSGELRNALITTAYIPSFRDPLQQLRINDYSWYGKLIRKLYQQRTAHHTAQIAYAHESLALVLNEVFQSATDALKTVLEEAIFYNQISFRASADTHDDEHKQIMLFVDDGIDAPYYEKGSGIQSALIIGLFTYYCRTFHLGSSLLLAEEPELYLHPQARRAIEGRLADFVAHEFDTVCSRQVIVSSHAPEFLRSVELEAITCIRKTQGDITSQVFQITETIDDDQRRHWQQIFGTKNGEMLFADHVLLVEGGEEFILPPLADIHLKGNRWLDTRNVSVIRVDGKTRFKEYVKVLKQFGITYSILTDFDFLRDCVGNFQEELDPEAQRALEAVRQVIALAVKSPPKGSDIKGGLDPRNRDWVNVYRSVDDALGLITSGVELSQEHVGAIAALWNNLQDRIDKSNLRDIFPEGDPNLNACIEGLRRIHIYVLSKGDLENYITPEGYRLDPSKDRRAMALGQLLWNCPSINDANQWIDTSEICELLTHVAEIVNCNPKTHPSIESEAMQ